MKLTWKTEKPVWVDQWPLPAEKGAVLQELIKEQLKLGLITLTTSPWSSPICVIKKKVGNGDCYDLCQINSVTEDMGALQPRLPSPAMLPRNWNRLIIDLKDYFFTIPPHAEDAPRFAVSFPKINRSEPMDRYHWTLLPQRMKNAPTIMPDIR